MKHHPSLQEFNLGRALERRCINTTKTTICGECETCLLTQKIREIREWFIRFGDHSKKHFMLGLLGQVKSIALLKNIVVLLTPTITKDNIYARARTNPSLDTDTATVSSDRAISANKVEQIIASTWEWFSSAIYRTKINFILSLLHVCEAHLLYILYRQANTLLAAELNAAEILKENDKDEIASTVSTEYSYLSDEHPDLELLSMSRSEYSQIVKNPFTGESNSIQSHLTEGIIDTNSLSDISCSSFDPMILVIPTSAKAYAGVSRYKDFIRSLPVHLSKMILSMLDIASLYNALCVSPNWRKLVEEVRRENRVNQQIREEVMLMQGAAAHGANPVYAKDIDVLVPNYKPGTHEIIYTSDDVIKTTFKSEHTFQTAYSGVSTKKIIMEERNIFCGTYNVMVVIDTEDNHRVMHTDGSNCIAVGSKDRKVRFVDCDTGKETGPVITGHAGSVTCCFLLHDKDMVLSGSYDTSIRCWSIKTGKCLKILRNHQDTVNCITVLGDVVASGSLDKCCKIWSLETGKCKKTFKHRTSVLAVALSEEICISGCESGKVKVWELGSGTLIKILNGHHAAVIGIKFDRWHIITGGKDGYALVWSTVGQHSQCLTALRHPKEVLCLEFAYLRVITGSADGRIRIWNMLTGQCCRIMRGNSHSDPIISIIAIGDRITVNTLNSLLVMNFEKVNWDYTLEADKVLPLVRYGSYGEAPLRSQPYPYVRAQRMRRAGASNYKIIHHSSPLLGTNTTNVLLQHQQRAAQLPHSARSLSRKSLQNAKRKQSSLKSLDISLISADTSSYLFSSQERHNMVEQYIASTRKKMHSAEDSKAKNKSASSTFHVVTKEQSDDDVRDVVKKTNHISRRISWAFEKPLVPKDRDISLTEMKALLRSQIRMKSDNIIPPDFISLTVSTIQKSMAKSESSYDAKINMQDWKPSPVAIRKRPTSSPSHFDTRTKVSVETPGMEAFHSKDRAELSTLPAASLISLHPNIMKTPIPAVHSLSFCTKAHDQREHVPVALVLPPRPLTSPVKLSSSSIRTIPVRNALSLPGDGHFLQKSKSNVLSTTSPEASDMRMLFNTEVIKEKTAKLKEISRQNIERRSDGRVSIYTHPLRENVNFELRTHQQEEEYLIQTQLFHSDQKKKENEGQQKKKKAAWLALATGKPNESVELQTCAGIELA